MLSVPLVYDEFDTNLILPGCRPKKVQSLRPLMTLLTSNKMASKIPRLFQSETKTSINLCENDVFRCFHVFPNLIFLLDLQGENPPSPTKKWGPGIRCQFKNLFSVAQVTGADAGAV